MEHFEKLGVRVSFAAKVSDITVNIVLLGNNNMTLQIIIMISCYPEILAILHTVQRRNFYVIQTNVLFFYVWVVQYSH